MAAKFFISNLCSISQAGRRGFESVSRSIFPIVRVADLSLDKEALKAVIRKNGWSL
jgi:hypothetical protein